MKKRLRLIGGVALAALCLWLSFRNIAFASLWESLKEANYWWLVPAMLMVVVSMVLRALRWQCLLKPTKMIGFMDLLSAIFICFMANNILPARMGELIRAVLVGKKQKISMTTVFATVVLERLFDMMSVMAIFLSLLFIHPFEPNVKKAGFILTALYVAALVFLVAARIFSGPVTAIVHRVLSVFSRRFAGRMIGIVDSFFKGLNVLKDWRQVLLIVVYSVVLWVTIVVTYYLLCLIFAVRIPAYGYLLVVVFLGVAVMFPAPGYVGTFHFAYRKALGVFGVAPAVALSCAIVAHASQYIFITIVGVLFLWRENISFSELKREEREGEMELDHMRKAEPVK